MQDRLHAQGTDPVAVRVRITTALAFVVIVATVVPACHRHASGEAERNVATTGVFPIIVPENWKLVGRDGLAEGLPTSPGATFFRIRAMGALLVTEQMPTANDQSEALMVRGIDNDAPITAALLEQYVERVITSLEKEKRAPRIDEKRLLASRLGSKPVGNLIVARTAPADSRVEVHYLVHDRAGKNWEIVYLLRQVDLASWRPWFDEMESPAP